MPVDTMAKNSLYVLVCARAGLEPAAYCLGGKPEPGQTTLAAALHSSDPLRQSPDDV
jgi:hypothetical protein